MPTLEERVQKLEDDVKGLQSRTDVNEAETIGLAELIKVESRFTNSKIDRLTREMGEMKRDMVEMKQQFGTFPRVMAEVVREVMAEMKPKV